MNSSFFLKFLILIVGLLGGWQIYVFVRLYFYTSCFIPTDSMLPTIVAGDYIAVSLLIPGKRIITENLNGTFELKRNKGIRKVSKYDIVVFNYPYWGQEKKMVINTEQYHCKRCVALPGEMYYWKAENNMTDSIFLPKVGSRLLIDSLNFEDYYRCIEYETGIMPIKKNDGVYHADTLLLNYEFKNDYYFMQGDNIVNSYDSRTWGILPEDFIMGVAAFVWYSKNLETQEIRWNRLFHCL